MSVPCRFCGAPVADERVEIGKDHCMARQCVGAYIRERREGIRLILVPKQGFTIVTPDDPVIKTGRASGKT